MCLTKVYYNTYSDGAQDITEKSHPCRDGRGCSHPDVRKYDRKFPFAKLGDAQPESHRSLSERQPTPYFTGDTPRGPKSPSPSRRRNSGVYMSGGNHYDYGNPYGNYDAYGYGASSRHDPRDRYDRDREPRLKRSSTAPQIVYMDRDGKSSSRTRSRSNSSSRDYSRDIPLGLVPLADEYGRRHRRHSSSSSRSHSRDDSRDGSDSHRYHRHRRTDDPVGYTVIDDADERRRARRERRQSVSDYPASSTTMGYLPRRAATVVHHGAEPSSSGRKQLRWEDEVSIKRAMQNEKIASRPVGDSAMIKGILKHTGEGTKGKGKGKAREDEIADLRRAVERMDIPRGRDRKPKLDEWGRGYDYDDDRRKRSKVWGDWYRY